MENKLHTKMKWNILLFGMSDENTLNNILNTLVTCYWELPWANSLNHVIEIPIEIGTECMNLLW